MPIDRIGRLSKNGLVDGTTPAPYCAAATMKHGDAHIILSSQFRQPELGLVEFPTGGQDAAVLATIRIAKHYLLLLTTVGKIEMIVWMGESLFQNFCAIVEIINRLKQRHNREIVDTGLFAKE